MTNTTTFYRPSDSPVTDRIGRLYIDMKATGPNRRRKDEVWQFAYIYEGPDGLLVSGNHYIQHSMRPTKWVMDHTSYDKVDPKMFRPPSEAFVELFDFSIPESDPEQVYIYAAQPSFAESFLQRYLQYYNLLSVQYERQLMCIESYVATLSTLNTFRRLMSVLNSSPSRETRRSSMPLPMSILLTVWSVRSTLCPAASVPWGQPSVVVAAVPASSPICSRKPKP